MDRLENNTNSWFLRVNVINKATRDMAVHMISLDSLPVDLSSCGYLVALYFQCTIASTVFLLKLPDCFLETCVFVF